jgi:prolyl oligopeptidase
VDIYHGVKVADPYRWLEDDNSPETKAWVEAENKVTFGYLEKIPQRAAIKEQLTKLWNYERYNPPFKKGGRYFFTKNDGLQNQSVLYTMMSLEAAPVVLLDPNKLSADGTVALSGMAMTDDGNRMAYGLESAGSDWQEWKVRDVTTGQDLPDQIRWVKFSGASWTKDGMGFYYSRYDQPSEASKLTQANYFHKLYHHRLGTAQSEDKLVYERPDQKEWLFEGNVTHDGRYLIISVQRGTDPRSSVFYLDLGDPSAKVVELLPGFEAKYVFIDNDGPTFWFQADLNAPRGRVVAIDTTQPAKSNWKEIIRTGDDALEGVHAVGGRFVASYLKDARTMVKLFALDGTFAREISFPGLGSAFGFGGKRTDRETFYVFSSFTVPGRVYRYDFDSGNTTLWREPKLAFDASKYETRQVFYRSKDGTRVPMFITSRKGLEPNGKNPTLLYGYGGFDINITPFFWEPKTEWLELGGVFAVANIRGGGEYGEPWHEAGMKLHKQNVFDDFIAAAEWLCGREPAAKRWGGAAISSASGASHFDPPELITRPAKLAIQGGSNGGLLVGACETQRPDLFGACLPAVGVMDMLRFNKFTIGWAWTSDYGSPENPEEFKALYAYSPLHHIRKGTAYPATFITTADHDDRVVPAHSFKFAATMQAAQSGSNPILIRVETRAGHGGGKPTDKQIDESADELAFLVKVLRVR